jgi:hypothetical protein
MKLYKPQGYIFPLTNRIYFSNIKKKTKEKKKKNVIDRGVFSKPF